MTTQAVPQSGKWTQASQRGHAARAQVGDHAQEIRTLTADVGLLERVIQAPSLLTKAEEPACLLRAAELRNRICGERCVRQQIKRIGTTIPGMPCQHTDRLQLQNILERGAKVFKHLVQHPPHGEDSRAAVHPDTVDLHLSDFSTGLMSAFDKGDIQAAMRQHQRADQAANASAYHHHTGGSQDVTHSACHAIGPEPSWERNAQTWIQKNSRVGVPLESPLSANPFARKHSFQPIHPKW
jgi:hypothetical protein